MTTTATTAIKTGWVIEMKKNSDHHPGFYARSQNCYCHEDVTKAKVCSSRRKARDSVYTSTEVVRKVEVDDSGKAIKLIPGR